MCWLQVKNGLTVLWTFFSDVYPAFFCELLSYLSSCHCDECHAVRSRDMTTHLHLSSYYSMIAALLIDIDSLIVSL